MRVLPVPAYIVQKYDGTLTTLLEVYLPLTTVQIYNQPHGTFQIELKNASFGWGDAPPTATGVNLKLEKVLFRQQTTDKRQ